MKKACPKRTASVLRTMADQQKERTDKKGAAKGNESKPKDKATSSPQERKAGSPKHAKKEIADAKEKKEKKHSTKEKKERKSKRKDKKLATEEVAAKTQVYLIGAIVSDQEILIVQASMVLARRRC